MTLYRNKYRSETFQIKNWDYGAPGHYYVTVCTKNHEHFFGEVVLCACGENDNYTPTAQKEIHHQKQITNTI
jgi:hypothetical protein